MILNSRKLQLFVAECHIGQKVKLTVIRDGQPLIVIADIVGSEAPVEEEKAIETDHAIDKSGVIFSNLSPAIAVKFNFKESEKGVAVIAIATQEQNTDLQIGDLILTMDQQYISDTDQFNRIYETLKAKNKKSTVLLVKRRDFNIFVALAIK